MLRLAGHRFVESRQLGYVRARRRGAWTGSLGEDWMSARVTVRYGGAVLDRRGLERPVQSGMVGCWQSRRGSE